MPVKNRLSILIPLYNEEEFVAPLLERVVSAPLLERMDREIIIVDDGSSDESPRIVQEFQQSHPGLIRFIRHERNRGKGAAIRTAIEHAQGEFSIIQDADLEYDPKEYRKLLAPLAEGRADAVYGSRFAISGERRVLYFWHALANHILTTLCNLASDLNLTDMETCYKAFRTELIQSIPIRSERFGIEPEITIKLAQRQARLYEVPISYYGRTYEEGKKIGFKDAIDAFFVILRYWIRKDIYRHAGGEILDILSDAPRFNSWMADTVRPFLGAKVLELGAGIGNLSRHLCRMRQRYVASDIDEQHLARLRARFQDRPRLEIHPCNLEVEADFVPFAGQMDSVVCLNVLEHVKDDVLGLRNLYTALRPGGTAIVLVPHDHRIYGSLDEVLGHFRRYSSEELRTRMEQVGFRVDRILDFNRAARPGWYLNGRLLRKTTFSRLQLHLFDRMVWFWRHADGWLPWKSNSIIAVAVKPALPATQTPDCAVAAGSLK